MKFEFGVLSLKGKNDVTYCLKHGLLLIHSLMAFMELVLNGTDTCYKTVPCGKGTRQIVTGIGRHHIHRLHQYFALYSRMYKFSPAPAFFFSLYAQHRIRHCEIYTLKDLCGDGETAAEIADDFIAVLRKEAVRIGLKKKIHNWNSKVKKNQKRMVMFSDTIFDMCSKPLILRADFNNRLDRFTLSEMGQVLERVDAAYQADQEALAVQVEALLEENRLNVTGAELDGLPAPRVFRGRASLEQVKSDRKRFFKRLQNEPVYKHLLGYAWRIDCALEAGFHMHVVFFFDGHELEDHEYYCDLLGKLFEEIVGDRGYFYNVNRDKEKYGPNGKWALGTVRHNDHMKRNLLNVALGYLSEDDKIAQFVMEDSSHMFGTVFVKKPKAETRGRPRKQAA